MPIILAKFTLDGTPQTGLSPTIDIYDLSDDSLDVSGAAMNEVALGMYSYDFTTGAGYDDAKDWAYRCDGTATITNDSERYQFGMVEGVIDEIKAVADAIEVDTTAIEADTQDIQSRLPAALVAGAIDADVSAIQAGAITAAAITAAAVAEIQLGLATAEAIQQIIALVGYDKVVEVLARDARGNPTLQETRLYKDGTASRIDDGATRIIARVPQQIGEFTTVSVDGHDRDVLSKFTSSRGMFPSLYVYKSDNALGTGPVGTMYAININLLTGVLTELAVVDLGGVAVGLGGDGSTIKLHEATGRLFVANGDSLAILDVNQQTGAATPVAGSPFASGKTSGYGVVVNAAGDRAFMAHWASPSFLCVYDIDADGVASHVAGSPFTMTGNGADVSVLSMDEKFLFTNLENSAAIETSAIGPNGLITSLGLSAARAGFGWSLYHRPGKKQLFQPTDTTITVWEYDDDGTVTEIAGSPFAIAGASKMQSLSFTPDGDRCYVGATPNRRAIYAFDLADDGTPTIVPGFPHDATGELTYTNCVSVSKDGRLLTAMDGDDTPAQCGVYAIAKDGSLTPVAGSPFSLSDLSNCTGIVSTY